MNRVIKFRAWHNERCIMLYPPRDFDSHMNCIDNKGNYYKDFLTQEYFAALMTWDGRVYINGVYQDLTWLQFTGYKDEKGKEVYDGDIIFDEFEAWGVKYYIIGWENDGWSALNKKKESISYHGGLPKLKDYCISGVVIGNIYENSELLKE